MCTVLPSENVTLNISFSPAEALHCCYIEQVFVMRVCMYVFVTEKQMVELLVNVHCTRVNLTWWLIGIRKIRKHCGFGRMVSVCHVRVNRFSVSFLAFMVPSEITVKSIMNNEVDARLNNCMDFECGGLTWIKRYTNYDSGWWSVHVIDILSHCTLVSCVIDWVWITWFSMKIVFLFCSRRKGM